MYKSKANTLLIILSLLMITCSPRSEKKVCVENITVGLEMDIISSAAINDSLFFYERLSKNKIGDINEDCDFTICEKHEYNYIFNKEYKISLEKFCLNNYDFPVNIYSYIVAKKDGLLGWAAADDIHSIPDSFYTTLLLDDSLYVLNDYIKTSIPFNFSVFFIESFVFQNKKYLMLYVCQLLGDQDSYPQYYGLLIDDNKRLIALPKSQLSASLVTIDDFNEDGKLDFLGWDEGKLYLYHLKDKVFVKNIDNYIMLNNGRFIDFSKSTWQIPNNDCFKK